MKDALTKANLPLAAPSRGDNGKAGDAKTPGTTVANIAQQAYFADVASKVVLPMFKARNKPFVLVFWSRDPDGSQHNTGDSLNAVTPGINGPTSMAGIKNADDNLAQLRKALDDLGLSATTNIVIVGRPRLLDDFEGKQDQPVGEGDLRRHAEGFPADGLPRARSGEGARPAAVRSQRQERARRRQCAPEGRQRRARKGSGKTRSGGRHQWRIGPDLSAEQGQEAGRSRRQGAARTGLCQRAVRRRQARPLPRHLADVAAQPEGQGGDAESVDRGQLPLLCAGVQRTDQLLRRSRRHGAAAGPGHARQLRPRRHHEFHGGDRSRISKPAMSTRCRSAMPTSA